MDTAAFPPLPSIKKRKPKATKRGSAMTRSRSFVAEMLHSKKATNAVKKKWSNNELQILEKLGVNVSAQDGNNNNGQIQIAGNLHPDLKRHALEEEVNALQAELSQTKNNLMVAAEFGQHLIEENQHFEAVVLELRNEAAEYIAQLCEFREDNDRFQASLQSNECSVSEYEDKLYQFKRDRDELKEKLSKLRAQTNDYKLKYEMEANECKLYAKERQKDQTAKKKVCAKYDGQIREFETKILILQNRNHKLAMERDAIHRKCEQTTQEMDALHHEYNELCREYKAPFQEFQDAASISGDSRHRFTNISRRRSLSRSRSDKREDLEEKMEEIGNEKDECNEVLAECMDLFENIMEDQHIASPIKAAKANNENSKVDMEVFVDLMESVRRKLKTEKYGGDIRQRNISELRRNSKSNSNMETFDCYIAENEENEEKEEEEERGVAVLVEYEADNEDLDNLPNEAMRIEPIDENQKQCVEQFLVRYSENNSWNDNVDENDAYELEIEFNENVSLENKKKNNISISSSLLQSLTDLIENIMGIPSYVHHSYYKDAYFSICGWFCGKSAVANNANNDYSTHYLNILSALDYNAENREEIYWVIYQLLNVIYKYINHTQKGNVLDEKDVANGDDLSDSEESVSMVCTQTKSKYAELKPPKRRRDKKNRKKSRARASFHPLNNISSEDDDI